MRLGLLIISVVALGFVPCFGSSNSWEYPAISKTNLGGVHDYNYSTASRQLTILREVADVCDTDTTKAVIRIECFDTSMNAVNCTTLTTDRSTITGLSLSCISKYNNKSQVLLIHDKNVLETYSSKGKSVSTFVVPLPIVSQIDISPSGRYLYINSGRKKYGVYDLAVRKMLWLDSVPGNKIFIKGDSLQQFSVSHRSSMWSSDDSLLLLRYHVSTYVFSTGEIVSLDLKWKAVSTETGRLIGVDTLRFFNYTDWNAAIKKYLLLQHNKIYIIDLYGGKDSTSIVEKEGARAAAFYDSAGVVYASIVSLSGNIRGYRAGETKPVYEYVRNGIAAFCSDYLSRKFAFVDENHEMVVADALTGFGLANIQCGNLSLDSLGFADVMDFVDGLQLIYLRNGQVDKHYYSIVNKSEVAVGGVMSIATAGTTHSDFYLIDSSVTKYDLSKAPAESSQYRNGNGRDTRIKAALLSGREVLTLVDSGLAVYDSKSGKSVFSVQLLQTDYYVVDEDSATVVVSKIGNGIGSRLDLYNHSSLPVSISTGIDSAVCVYYRKASGAAVLRNREGVYTCRIENDSHVVVRDTVDVDKVSIISYNEDVECLAVSDASNRCLVRDLVSNEECIIAYSDSIRSLAVGSQVVIINMDSTCIVYNWRQRDTVVTFSKKVVDARVCNSVQKSVVTYDGSTIVIDNATGDVIQLFHRNFGLLSGDGSRVVYTSKESCRRLTVYNLTSSASTAHADSVYGSPVYVSRNGNCILLRDQEGYVTIISDTSGQSTEVVPDQMLTLHDDECRCYSGPMRILLLPGEDVIEESVYDHLGRSVRCSRADEFLVDEKRGSYEFERQELPSGIYFVLLTTPKRVLRFKIMLAKS